ncbi:MAG: signal peptidase [Phycisphaerae bacterium]|nr:signal peptidase [Phycisphaerae bacterium]
MDNEELTAPEPDDSHPAPPADPAPEDNSSPQSSPEQDGPASGTPQQMDQQPSEQTQPSEDDQERTALVCYGRMNLLGEFRRPDNGVFPVGTKVIVRTERGIEIGRIVLGYCEGCGDRGISRQKWQQYLGQEGQDYDVSRQGRIVRQASEQDLIDQGHLDRNAAQKLEFCRKLIDEMRLNMKLVDVEHLFGGDRIIFHFKSEKRVDFRKLVRRLAKEYQTRIEMRQVGARDEARLLADYERCGRECCCRAFLKHLAPVNMRMAKVQKATLDPAKISGRCGRLMCCLRYEHRTYDELRKKLPPRNTLVETPEGQGLVVDRQILTQLVMVRLADARRVAFPLSEITVVSNEPDSSAQPKTQPDAKENSSNTARPSQQGESDSDAKSGGPRKRRRNKRRNPSRPQG